MADLTLVLFDDEAARGWEPFALTRPAGELLFGTMRLRERAERVFGVRCAAHLAAEHLAGFEEAGAPPVRGTGDAPADGARLFLSSRAVPAWGAAERLPAGPSEAATLTIGGETVGWLLPAGVAAPGPEALLRPGEGNVPAAPIDLPGRVLRHVWELMSATPEQIGVDVAALYPSPAPPELPAGVHLQGGHPLVLGEGARIEPGVVVDTSEGPVWLDEGATVRAFTRLAGPAYVGRGSTVLGGAVEACAIGPVCRIRGEFAESVALAYANKQHDGHIGHAYLGAWVNLGAETTNSDLKNNYGTVRLWTPDGETDTGEIKMGCFLGDHVKTGIGLLLNTGTVIGAGSNLYGAAMPPRYVPPFSWGTGDELTAYRLDKFLEVAERAMSRRKVALPEGMRAQLGRAWERGRPDAG
ncbi:MAG TPA: putative sugar nucleotidyl transferase [Longimicrobiaceae bacterium]|nr:putative sugar nucleotidyl transferase [Longimicrobiaceae bacterium]